MVAGLGKGGTSPKSTALKVVFPSTFLILLAYTKLMI